MIREETTRIKNAPSANLWKEQVRRSARSKLDKTYSRAQFIDDIRNIVLWMEFKIAWPIRSTATQPRRHYVEFYRNFSLRGIIIKFTHEILACSSTRGVRAKATGCKNITLLLLMTVVHHCPIQTYQDPERKLPAQQMGPTLAHANGDLLVLPR